ncbi:MAG: transaldolase [Burkholderiaceae bacterium]|nr:transaldolase [Burkholderiaceae bacterium]
MNPLQQLKALGQSVWMDDIRRAWIDDGTIARLIAQDGLCGLTSNPAIFHKAMSAGAEYEAPIRALVRAGQTAGAIYETLAVEDVRATADLLRATWENSDGRDGFVSLEVSPHLADDTRATVQEARRLWRALDRPNAMIKVPGTAAGLPAITALLAEGINVNVTLLFGLARYRAVADCFVAGLEQRAAAGGPLRRVASVASFFVSRIDTLVDARLEALDGADARALRGRAAIASARLAHAIYREWTQQPRWKRLTAAGAAPQRLLWASTSTKDPAYADTMYVEALVGPDTVNTMPPATLDAYRDHGQPALRLDGDIDAAREVHRALAALGIDLEAASIELERDGVRKFVEPFERLHAMLEQRLHQTQP